MTDELVERLAARMNAMIGCSETVASCSQCTASNSDSCLNVARSCLAEIAAAGYEIRKREPEPARFGDGTIVPDGSLQLPAGSFTFSNGKERK